RERSAVSARRAKRKESGRLLPLSFCLAHGEGELLRAFVPLRDGRGHVVRIHPQLDFLPGGFGADGRHPAHDLVHHFDGEVTEVKLRKTVRHRVYNPSLSLLSVGVGLATRHISREVGGVPRSVKVERRRQTPFHLFVGTLSGRGACYPAEKARSTLAP